MIKEVREISGSCLFVVLASVAVLSSGTDASNVILNPGSDGRVGKDQRLWWATCHTYENAPTSKLCPRNNAPTAWHKQLNNGQMAIRHNETNYSGVRTNL